MSTAFNYTIDGKTYQVNIIRKRIKNIYFRFQDDQFFISCGRLTSERAIIGGLNKYARKMIQRAEKKASAKDETLYIFGVPYDRKYPINLTTVSIIDTNEDEKLKTLLMDYLFERIPYFVEEMGIKEIYKIKVRNTKTRLGSNSRRTKTWSFSLQLVHFSKEIIDSVIVHELAHCKVFDHSSKFYDVVYQHCPNYNVLRKKLIHSEFN